MTVIVTEALNQLETVTVDELVQNAALQTRIDRKYVVTSDQLDELLARLAGRARVLDIEGRRRFEYESVYFDTPSFDTYLAAAHGRPNRFKIRTRSYLADDACWIEVKLRNRAGQTVKHRFAHDFDQRHRLTDPSVSFANTFPALSRLTDRLEPTLTTRYRRSTLLVDGTRITIDHDVICTAVDGRRVGLDEEIIVETKSGGRSVSAADRALWALHLRPVTISKYGVGIAALHPDLPSNKWHRTLQRHVTVEPAN